jgi:hypothetical protein
MGLSAEVRELLQQGREDAVAELAAANRRALRPLLGRLWDPELEIRRRAARAVGRAAGHHPDLGLEIIRRLMWALNDESATNGVHAVPALGEIGRRSPDLIAPFVAPLASLGKDDGLRLEILRALTEIARSAPDRVGRELPRLSELVDRARTDERRAFENLEAATRGNADAS